jgi:hypothetical protein
MKTIKEDWDIWSNFCIEHFDQRSAEFKRKLKFSSTFWIWIEFDWIYVKLIQTLRLQTWSEHIYKGLNFGMLQQPCRQLTIYWVSYIYIGVWITVMMKWIIGNAVSRIDHSPPRIGSQLRCAYWYAQITHDPYDCYLRRKRPRAKDFTNRFWLVRNREEIFSHTAATVSFCTMRGYHIEMCVYLNKTLFLIG